ncbi:hypothetical protein Hanom_Chr05g00417261 [Helianthus anomalus]
MNHFAPEHFWSGSWSKLRCVWNIFESSNTQNNKICFMHLFTLINLSAPNPFLFTTNQSYLSVPLRMSICHKSLV